MKYKFDDLEATALVETYVVNSFVSDKNQKFHNLDILSKKLNLYGRQKYPNREFDGKYRNVNGMILQSRVLDRDGFKSSKIIEYKQDLLFDDTEEFIKRLREFYKYDYSSIGYNKDELNKSIDLLYKYVENKKMQLNEKENKINWDKANFDIPWSKPIRAKINGIDLAFNYSWRSLYISIIEFLLKQENYKYQLLQYRDKKFFGAKRDLFNSKAVALQNLTQDDKDINDEYTFLSEDLYLYNKLSAENILSRILRIIELLGMEKEYIEIYYLNTGEDKLRLNEVNHCDEYEEGNNCIELYSYESNEKRKSNFKNISSRYNDLIEPIIELVFDDGDVFYNIRTEYNTEFKYRIDGYTGTEEIKYNNDKDTVERFIEIINKKNVIKKLIIYYEKGYDEIEVNIDNEEFESYIKGLYKEYYYINKKDLEMSEYDGHFDNVKCVLIECFKNGFRLDDNLELNTFKLKYKENFNDDIISDENTEDFYDFLRNNFVEIDDKIYVKECLITEEVNNKIENFINNIKENDNILPSIKNTNEYLMTIEYFSKQCNIELDISNEKLISCIYNELLDTDDYSLNKMSKGDSNIYISILFNSNDEDVSRLYWYGRNALYSFIDGIIANFLKLDGSCVQLKDIYNKLSYLHSEDIKSVAKSRYYHSNRDIRSKEVIYDDNGTNTPDDLKSFFYIDSFPIKPEDCEKIKEMLKEKEDEGWKPVDLKKIIKKHFPNETQYLDDENFHNYAIERCIDILINKADDENDNYDIDNDYDDNDECGEDNSVNNSIDNFARKVVKKRPSNINYDNNDKEYEYDEIKNIKVNNINDALKILFKGIKS
ncbi:MAG: hypothetical protein IJP71_06710 [Lachnospiraceae bacterium]|nr:hypothetical protein [Lachnospiraceae bacterium]